MNIITPNFFFYLLTMAAVTYLVRMLPLVFFRRRIESRFVRSFLYYVPYAVLTAMTLPAIFYSTEYLVSGIVGFAVAVILAYFKRGLLFVAVAATLAVMAVEGIMTCLPIG